MLIVDSIILALVLLAGVWGYRRGLTVGAFALLGFGAGAVLGSRVVALVLEDGLRSPYAPILALPGALLCGGLLATALEALGFRLGGRFRGPAALDGAGGALLGACLGIVAVWLVGAALVRADGLRDPLRDSSVLERLNAVLPPPGPVLRAEAGRPPDDPFPRFAGPRPRLRAPGAAILTDADVRAARRSVVRVTGLSCEHGVTGSGWIAPGGIVVTNGHVVAGQRGPVVQVGGRGPALKSTPIWFEEQRADLALLRVPALAGAPALRLAPRPRAGTSGAVLGFPGGGPYTVEAARLGPTFEHAVDARVVGRPGAAPRTLRMTTLLGRVRPGNSGGPVVDRHGRVLTTVFGGRTTGLTAYGVPASAVRRALRRAGKRVATGRCPAR